MNSLQNFTRGQRSYEIESAQIKILLKIRNITDEAFIITIINKSCLFYNLKKKVKSYVSYTHNCETFSLSYGTILSTILDYRDLLNFGGPKNDSSQETLY